MREVRGVYRQGWAGGAHILCDELWITGDSVRLTSAVHHRAARLLDVQTAGHQPAGGAGEAQAGASRTEQRGGV